tara:strand:- start:1719 stop:2696 length:978 start_codon:yes stop_codon:yes gene_type:complete
MDARKEFLSKFLITNNIASSGMHLIESDASFRKYYRIKGNKFLIMDAPHEKGESVQSFKRIDKILIGMGISAPVIYNIDEENGYILLEDLGDEKFSQILNKKNEHKLYQIAVNVLAHIYLESKKKEFNSQKISNYSINLLIEESKLFCDWYMQEHCKIELTSSEKSNYQQILKKIYNQLELNSSSLVLRDYHVDNLIFLKDRKGINQVGVIDFQDAVIGSNAYDLVSLLEDVRRPITIELKNKLIKEYVNATDCNLKELIQEMKFFSIQRNLKIIGIFSRLKYRDQKSQYMKLINSSWKFINLHLEESNFAELKSWILNYKDKFL